MKTPAEILAVLTPPSIIAAAEYRAIFETISDGLEDVFGEAEGEDDTLTWAKSVCEEYIAHAQWILEQLDTLE